MYGALAHNSVLIGRWFFFDIIVPAGLIY